ncbi:unnamed protein product [Owenia fusiformis]|uniref:Uncharacterized protein n=1 Tax=Owenia fusiformis TaxID=6347 RepID=A0A8J1TII1_OWEFU|nr:unnamed protein product [Owenia fusiformis]
MQLFTLLLIAICFSPAVFAGGKKKCRKYPNAPGCSPPDDDEDDNPDKPPLKTGPKYVTSGVADKPSSGPRANSLTSLSGSGQSSALFSVLGLSTPCGYWVITQTSTREYAGSWDPYGIRFWNNAEAGASLKFPINNGRNDKEPGSWDAYGVIQRSYIPLPPTWIRLSNESGKSVNDMDNWKVKRVLVFDTCFGKIYEFEANSWVVRRQKNYLWIERTFASSF